MLLLILYGSLAALALWATWRQDDLRWIGIALVFSFVASNLVWFFGDVESRPGAFTMCEILVALAAFMTWEDTRLKMLPVLVMINAVSITANIAFAMNLHPKWAQIHNYEVITNICFALECLVTIGMGVAHRVSIGSIGIFNWRLGSRDDLGQSHDLRGRKP